MPKSLLLLTMRMPGNRATSRLEFVRHFRLNRWLTYLILVPIAAATTLLAIFFFAVFVGLFAAAIVVVALRLWWLRRKLRQDDHASYPIRFSANHPHCRERQDRGEESTGKHHPLNRKE
jgi:hypothetical protein